MSARNHVTSLLLVVFAFLFPGFTSIVNAQADSSRVFIFGDSLSDSGNVYALTGETAKAPYAVIPAAPYAIGGHQFSNGKTWAENFAQALGDNNGGKAALDSPGRNGNYAFGGARARTVASPIPSSVAQVGMYLADHSMASAGALYVIQFGGNDLRDALVAGASDPTAVQPIMTAAIGDIATSIQTLYFAGARRFLVANAPNLEHAPAVRFSGAGAVAGLLTGLFNGNLEGTLQLLELGLPGIEIARLDLGGFVNDVVASPADFELTNVIAPCLSFMTESDAKCENPEDYLFWDGIHPTKAAHAALADRAIATISH